MILRSAAVSSTSRGVWPAADRGPAAAACDPAAGAWLVAARPGEPWESAGGVSPRDRAGPRGPAGGPAGPLGAAGAADGPAGAAGPLACPAGGTVPGLAGVRVSWWPLPGALPCDD